MTEEQIYKEYLEQQEIYYNIIDNVPLGLSYEEFAKLNKQAFNKFKPYSQNYKKIKTPTYEEFDDYGDVMTLDKFIANVECGGFIDYDGTGYYAKENLISNISISPTDILDKNYRTDHDYVVWYNR